MSPSIRSALLAAIVEVKGISLPGEFDSILLATAEIDSLDLIEIGFLLEDSLGIELDNDRFVDLATVGDFLAEVERQATKE